MVCMIIILNLFVNQYIDQNGTVTNIQEDLTVTKLWRLRD